MKVKQLVHKLNGELIELRRDFHRHPELGLEEFRTSQKVADYLEEIGLEVNRITETGVVGLIRGNQPGRTLMLRADMDALPLHEENELPYRSIHDGKMHACGHDGHTAMLLIAAKLLSRHKDKISGNIKFLFQPDEENMYADVLVEKGVLENPRVDAAMGIHLMSSIPTGKIGIKSGPVMAGMHVFKLTVRGKGGHTGFPQGSVDPILTATSIIQATQAIQTREIDVLKPTLIVFGKISGGTIYNIIPGSIETEGTIRYLYDIQPDSQEQPLKRFERIVQKICETHRATCEIEFSYSHPAVINDSKMADFVRATAAKVVESPDKIIPFVTMVGEDFCKFANKVPSAFYFIGTGNKDKGSDYPHHHASFNIDEDSLAIGVEMHVRTALSYLSAGS